MSISTEADDYKDAAKRDVESAIVNLSRILVEKCSGNDQYSAEYRAKIKKAFSTLIDISEEL